MADRVLFIGWNRPISGQERKGLEVFRKAMELFGKFQAEGRIESFEPVILSLHGGDLNAFILIKGDANKLQEVRGDETFDDLIMEAAIYTEGVGVVHGWIGEGLTDILARYVKLLGG